MNSDNEGAASSTSIFTNLTELQENRRHENYLRLLRCFYYIDKSVQALIWSILKRFWQNNSNWKEKEVSVTAPLEELVSQEISPKIKKCLKVVGTRAKLELEDVLANQSLSFLTPKNTPNVNLTESSTTTELQIDTTGLKAILLQCELFEIYGEKFVVLEPASGKITGGWLPSFHKIGKIRNDLKHDARLQWDKHRAEETKHVILKFFRELKNVMKNLFGDPLDERKHKIIKQSEKEVKKQLALDFLEDEFESNDSDDSCLSDSAILLKRSHSQVHEVEDYVASKISRT